MLHKYMSETLVFGCLLSILCFWIGKKIAGKLKWTICNPLLIASILAVAVIYIFHIEMADYERSSAILTKLLTPATISLAVPMYRQLERLKAYAGAILISIFSGVLAGGITIIGLAGVLGLSEEWKLSLMPKSITTAIAMGISEEIGGNPTLTVGVVVFTGLLGAIILKGVCKLFRITHPVAIGLACGNAAHAIGTTKAVELGEIEGAMSSLSIVVAGIMTVVVVPILAML
ncbi:MAG: LrgB family protein [Agathobacter sp.]|nr:LrgB family protein [Agathobacter sp.]